MILRSYLFLLLLIIPVCATAQEVRVAVASNFIGPIKTLAGYFEETTGIRIRLAIASSGKHYAQIIHGAPYDLFLSADQHKAKLLEEQGFGLADTRFTYAIGKLVLVSFGSGADHSAELLLKAQRFGKIALANPKLAPYGVAAVEVLNKLGLTESTQSRWIMGENISQTFQFLSTGNVDLGFIAQSQLVKIDIVSDKQIWNIPDELYTPIKQDALLLKRAKNNKEAFEFYRFLSSQEAQKIITSHGYKIINAKHGQ
ncbi:MAG: molybdate ABC transporter substrate-binding protein [Neptuniibacter sp.]